MNTHESIQQSKSLAALIIRATASNDQHKRVPMCSAIYPIRVMEGNIGNLIVGMDRRHTPISDHLFAKLRAPLRDYLPGEDEYQMAFDRFEYLFGLAHADMNRQILRDGWWGPVGCFAWRGRHFGGDRAVTRIGAEIEAEGSNWGPLKAGMFGGSLDRLKEAKAKFDAFIGILPFF